MRAGPIVRIAPNEVVIADPSAIKVIYGVKPGFPKVRMHLCHTRHIQYC